MTEIPSETAESNVTPEPVKLETYVPPRALFIVAHADDIEFGAAGTATLWTAAGSQITYCIVTDNGSGTDDPEMTRERLVQLREEEQRAAAAMCGVTDVIFMGYPDGTIVPSLDLRRDLVRVIRRVKPDVLITMDPTLMFTPSNDYINHPDHRAVCQTVLDAVFPAAGNRMIFPELLAEGLPPHKVTYVYLMFSENLTLTIDTTTTFDNKIEALKQHKSQINPDELAGFVGQWDKVLGEKAGYAYGEGYRVIKIN
ncbi:MAG: PIG-L family deacetylase [Chloroflexi bacterium]|nr:PIG-L family deacetylase [Chloroflexota bacterium]